MRITVDVSWMKELPDKCEACSLRGMDQCCVADEKGRFTDGWRPFWCPLTVHTEQMYETLFGFDTEVVISE